MISQPLPEVIFQDAISPLTQGRFFQMSLTYLDMLLFAWPFLFLCIIESWPCNMHRMANWKEEKRATAKSPQMDAGEDKAPNHTFLLFPLVPALSFLLYI